MCAHIRLDCSATGLSSKCLLKLAYSCSETWQYIYVLKAGERDIQNEVDMTVEPVV